MARRVVITGLGVATPIGCDLSEFWRAALQGRSGVRRIKGFDGFSLDGYRSQVAAEIEGFDPLQHFEPKKAERTDRSTQFALVATRSALADAGIELNRDDPYRVGISLGSAMGGIVIGERELVALYQSRQPNRVHPNLVPIHTVNAPSGQLAIEWGIKGPNLMISTACSSGAHAIGQAFNLIRSGQADVMISGGTEACITPLVLAAFTSLRTLSTHFNETPEKASRPFDRRRDGFVMGEGAGVLLLESLAHAMRRKARIYAEVVGWAATSDAHHMVIPEQSGTEVAKAIRLALQAAHLKPSQVDYINAHATSTPAGDQVEVKAIKQVFGPHAQKLLVNATKSMIGHAIGAAGAIGTIVAALTLEKGEVHPTINLEEMDPECALPGIRSEAEERRVRVALIHAFGFGSNNAVLALKRLP